MIRIVGGDLKKLNERAEFYKSTFNPIVYPYQPIIGFLFGEPVFLCPSPLIERERGACEKCQYRFECYTDKWGIPE